MYNFRPGGENWQQTNFLGGELNMKIKAALLLCLAAAAVFSLFGAYRSLHRGTGPLLPEELTAKKLLGILVVLSGAAVILLRSRIHHEGKTPKHAA